MDNEIIMDELEHGHVVMVSLGGQHVELVPDFVEGTRTLCSVWFIVVGQRRGKQVTAAQCREHMALGNHKFVSSSGRCVKGFNGGGK